MESAKPSLVPMGAGRNDFNEISNLLRSCSRDWRDIQSFWNHERSNIYQSYNASFQTSLGTSLFIQAFHRLPARNSTVRMCYENHIFPIINEILYDRSNQLNILGEVMFGSVTVHGWKCWTDTLISLGLQK